MNGKRIVKMRSAPEKISGVILDWAGTTVDYGSFAPVNAFEQIFTRRSIEPTSAEVRGPMGTAKREHIHTMLSGERLSELWKERHGREWDECDIDELYATYEDILFETLGDFYELKSGVVETVATLRERGIKIGSTTGYTPAMMQVVAAGALSLGYAPDTVVSPADVGYGRPWPYMIFENMRRLELDSVTEMLKVGDTISDIAESKNAGIYAVGVVEGSSEMGLRQEEYEALSLDERDKLCAQVSMRYFDAGADAVILELRDLLNLI